MVLSYIPHAWIYLDESSKVTLKIYLDNDGIILSQKQFLGLRSIDESIKNIIDNRMISVISDKLFIDAIKFYDDVVIEYIDRLIECYSMSKNFNASISIQNTIVKYIPFFNKQQIEKLISCYYNNRQCWKQVYSSDVIEAITESTVDTKANIEQLIADAEKTKNTG